MKVNGHYHSASERIRGTVTDSYGQLARDAACRKATLMLRQCLWLCPSVCPQHSLCRIDSAKRREPRRLPACQTFLPVR